MRIRALDGLRGIAAAAVVACHMNALPEPANSELGQMGVRVFFVLSGFLITRNLLRIEQESDDSARAYVGFIGRRALRLWPAAWLAIVVAWCVGVDDAVKDWPWYATFTANVLMAARDEWAGVLAPLWSLSVEEQFYLVWPILLWTCPREHRRVLFMALIAFAIPMRMMSYALGLEVGAWVLTPLRMDGLALGALLAVAELPLWTYALSLLAWQPWSASLAESGFVLIAAGAVRVCLGGTRVARALERRPLVAVGTISYGIYLWHLFVLVEFGEHQWPTWTALPTIAAVATLQWWCLERPVMRRNSSRSTEHSTPAHASAV